MQQVLDWQGMGPRRSSGVLVLLVLLVLLGSSGFSYILGFLLLLRIFALPLGNLSQSPSRVGFDLSNEQG